MVAVARGLVPVVFMLHFFEVLPDGNFDLGLGVFAGSWVEDKEYPEFLCVWHAIISCVTSYIIKVAPYCSAYVDIARKTFSMVA